MTNVWSVEWVFLPFLSVLIWKSFFRSHRNSLKVLFIKQPKINDNFVCVLNLCYDDDFWKSMPSKAYIYWQRVTIATNIILSARKVTSLAKFYSVRTTIGRQNMSVWGNTSFVLLSLFLLFVINQQNEWLPKFVFINMFRWRIAENDNNIYLQQNMNDRFIKNEFWQICMALVAKFTLSHTSSITPGSQWSGITVCFFFC